MRKYAADLQDYDRLVIDGREAVIDYILYDEQAEAVRVEGYFDDNGDEFLDYLDPDEEMVIA